MPKVSTRTPGGQRELNAYIPVSLQQRLIEGHRACAVSASKEPSYPNGAISTTFVFFLFCFSLLECWEIFFFQMKSHGTPSPWTQGRGRPRHCGPREDRGAGALADRCPLCSSLLHWQVPKLLRPEVVATAGWGVSGRPGEPSRWEGLRSA